jgi:hypothetical protein
MEYVAKEIDSDTIGPEALCVTPCQAIIVVKEQSVVD